MHGDVSIDRRAQCRSYPILAVRVSDLRRDATRSRVNAPVAVTPVAARTGDP
jgi:hypothetical protein